MDYPAGFFGGAKPQALSGAELHAAKIRAEGTPAEVIALADYAGVDALNTVRGVATEYLVMTDDESLNVKLSVR